MYDYMYRMYKKKVIELCSALARSLYILQKSFFHRKTRLLAFECHLFVKFEERLSKYEPNEDCRSKLHIFTSGHCYGSE